MNNIQTKFLSLCAALFIANSTHATIVDYGTYLTDTDTGLDWLDVTASINMSYNYVSSQFGSGGSFEGWRYASGDEFNTLVGHYTGVPITLGYYDAVVQEPDRIDGLVTLLGSTLDADYLARLGQTYDEFLGLPEGMGLDYTLGILSDPFGFNDLYLAFIYDYDIGQQGVNDFTSAHSGLISYTYAPLHIGSYLVRDSDHIGSIPEPTTVALMALGLAGLGISRRRASRQISR